MIVKDEEAQIGRCLNSVEALINTWTIVDTGSTDNTEAIIQQTLSDTPGQLLRREWRGFGPSLPDALTAAHDTAEWLLRVDADMTVETHPDLKTWLAQDPDPSVDAWMVDIHDHGTSYRLPLLVRGNLGWHYRGKTHEYLDTSGRKTRPLLGLTVHHHADGSNRTGKLERDLELLADQTDDRSTFYRAETLRFLGRTDEAVDTYLERAAMGGWDEESWYSRYQAARLQGSADGLIECWRARPWRHEPLSAAARIIAAGGARDDILFLETA